MRDFKTQTALIAMRDRIKFHLARPLGDHGNALREEFEKLLDILIEREEQ